MIYSNASICKTTKLMHVCICQYNVHNCIMDVYLGCSSDHLVFEGGAGCINP